MATMCMEIENYAWMDTKLESLYSSEAMYARYVENEEYEQLQQDIAIYRNGRRRGEDISDYEEEICRAACKVILGTEVDPIDLTYDEVKDIAFTTCMKSYIQTEILSKTHCIMCKNIKPASRILYNSGFCRESCEQQFNIGE